MSDLSFASYGKQFQEKIVQALLYDHNWAEQVLDYFQEDYLDLKYLQILVKNFFSYAKKYKTFPSLAILIVVIKDELKQGSDVALREQVIEYITRLKTNPDNGDLSFVKDKVLDFCRKQALKTAIENAVDQIEDNNKYESIVESIKTAIAVGTCPNVGHIFFEDHEARFAMMHRQCIATGLDAIDTKGVLNGGLSAGELGVVVAPTGVGKSHFLTFIGANALRNNYNVLHYTFELSEEAIGRRYDSNLCDIDSSLVIENKEKILQAYKDNGIKGNLVIKWFPTGSTTVYTLRSHIERLKTTKNFTPDIIIIDYADIMRSTQKTEQLRIELKYVYEEIRGLAGELKCPIWTASQSSKDGADATVVDLTQMSESYDKARTADVVLGVSRRPAEKAMGVGRLFVAKNRNGKDGLLFNINIDTSRSNFKIVSASGDFSSDQKELKKKLKNKLAEVEADAEIKNHLVDSKSIEHDKQEIVQDVIN